VRNFIFGRALLASLLITTSLAFPAAKADVVASNLDDPQTGSYGIEYPVSFAQEFSTGSASVTLGSITVPLISGTNAFTASVELLTDAGGLPGNSVLTTFTLPAIASTSFQQYVLSPNSSVTLAPNSNYWIAMSIVDSSGPQGFSWGTTNQNTSPMILNSAERNPENLQDQGWINYGYPPFLMEVDSLVPLPGTVWPMLSGLLALGAIGRKRALSRPR
jgi:hypothetical protein